MRDDGGEADAEEAAKEVCRGARAEGAERALERLRTPAPLRQQPVRRQHELRQHQHAVRAPSGGRVDTTEKDTSPVSHVNTTLKTHE